MLLNATRLQYVFAKMDLSTMMQGICQVSTKYECSLLPSRALNDMNVTILRRVFVTGRVRGAIDVSGLHGM